MGKMLQSRRTADVDLVFLREHGVALPSVVKALENAVQPFVTGTAIEVCENDGSTAGYLIYVPYTVQDYVDNFFRKNGGK